MHLNFMWGKYLAIECYSADTLRQGFKEVFDTGRELPFHKTLCQTFPLSEWGSLQRMRLLWMS